MSQAPEGHEYVPPFNAADTIVGGFRHISETFVPALRRHTVLLIVFLTITVFLQLQGMDAKRAVTFSAIAGRGADFGDSMTLAVLGLISTFVGLLFNCIIAMSEYQNAVGLKSRGYRVKFGTSEPPILAISEEVVTLFISGAKKALKILPAILAAAFTFAIATTLGNMIMMASFTGGNTAVLGFFQLIFRILSIITGLWLFQRNGRYYLFRVPVIAHRGFADEDAIAQTFRVDYPKSVRTPMFWKCLAVVVVSMLFGIVTGWLMEQVLKIFDIFENGGVGFTIKGVFSVAANLLSCLFFAGWMAQVWKPSGDAFPAAASEEPAADTAEPETPTSPDAEPSA
ncbi:MAG: hypothetical protein AAF225_12465 [Pseudomonadota bacterium]